MPRPLLSVLLATAFVLVGSADMAPPPDDREQLAACQRQVAIELKLDTLDAAVLCVFGEDAIRAGWIEIGAARAPNQAGAP